MCIGTIFLTVYIVNKFCIHVPFRVPLIAAVGKKDQLQTVRVETDTRKARIKYTQYDTCIKIDTDKNKIYII